MDILKAEMQRKRKQLEKTDVVNPEKKFFKRGDLAAYQNEEYWKKYYEKHKDKKPMPEQKPLSSEEALKVLDSPQEEGKSLIQISRPEVVRRLRERNEPITLFGEEENDSARRLRRLEIETPDMKPGWRNDFQDALEAVDQEFVREVAGGIHNREGKHDVKEHESEMEMEEIKELARNMDSTQPGKECELISAFYNCIISRWGQDLNSRPEKEKRSARGKFESATHTQTLEHMKPLLNSLKDKTVANDIRRHLFKITNLILLEGDFIKAGNAYMEMAIGNAPWPVGVTRSGIHQRPGSAKSYVENIAHVLNDETQRKYIQSVKRVLTKCQEYFPSDPSKS